MEGFEGLASAFDVENEDSFNKSIIEVKKDIQLIETKKTDIVNQINAPPIFKDQEFIQTELKTLIMSARTIMCKVEQDIKIGADARKIEVYAKLVESIGKQYQSLIELNKNIFDAQVQTNQININNIGENNKISLSSDQLLDMINAASAGSQMKNIDAHFEIENEYLPDMKKSKEDD